MNQADSLLSKTFLLNATENMTQGDSHESLPAETLPLNATEKMDQGISLSFEPPEASFRSRLREFTLVIPSASVSALFGSSVVLSCGLSPALNTRTFEVHWYKNILYENVVLLYKDQKVQENVGEEQNRNRVSLIGDLDKGNVSLKLENLTLVDGGCFVKSISWYEKGSVTLVVKALGSTPILLYHEAGEKMNVTRRSGGWSPKPMLTWRDSAGRELANSHTYYNTEGLGSGECYWEVMIWDKALKRKSSWSVGVIQKSQSEKKMIRALCYEGGNKA
ncbi:hypothetical protein KOW79_022352 [Hemibagrus wyckioides]|uniref:Ig-like domain-containing protein n=1 Tax=Hemibagrus wyckioides TaxID=337641 RepID=A0A9D3MZS3_9TELE|nr:hypothetical protein KOW79_022352 [Hemibagrus wyckioides]